MKRLIAKKVKLYLYRNSYFEKEVDVFPHRLTMTIVAWEHRGYQVKVVEQAS